MNFTIFLCVLLFSEFYCEDDVNKQGLECLRFLNEVISDFDAVSSILKMQVTVVSVVEQIVGRILSLE